jgi:hypothetical protein
MRIGGPSRPNTLPVTMWQGILGASHRSAGPRSRVRCGRTIRGVSGGLGPQDAISFGVAGRAGGNPASMDVSDALPLELSGVTEQRELRAVARRRSIGAGSSTSERIRQ